MTYGCIRAFFPPVNKAHVKIDPSFLSNQAAPPSSAGGAGTASTSTPAPPSAAAAVSAPSSSSVVGSKRKYHLRGADPLFARLRDSNFAVVGPKLSKEILRLDSEYKVRPGICGLGVTQLTSIMIIKVTTPSADCHAIKRFCGQAWRSGEGTSSGTIA